MQKHVIQRLTELLGEYEKIQLNLIGWHRADLDVAIRLDVPKNGGHYAQVWIPWPKDQDMPENAEHYPPQRPRNSVYEKFPLLGKSLSAAKFKIESEQELEELLAIIKKRMDPCTT